MEEELHLALNFLSRFAPAWSVYEHGASRATGAGNTIDHLHLHAVPLDFDIVEPVVRRLGSRAHAIDRLDHLRHVCTHDAEHYIFVMDAQGRKHVIPTPTYPSQFVRQITAEQIDRAALWNWRDNPLEDTCIATLREFKDRRLIDCTVYLAHSIENRSVAEVHRSIDHVRRELARYGCHHPLVSMFEVFEARLFGQGYFRHHNFEKMLVACETRYMAACDLVLADLSIPGHQYVGALMEIAYAHEMGLPVVAVVGDSRIGERLWLKAHCDLIVPTFADAVPFIQARLGPRRVE